MRLRKPWWPRAGLPLDNRANAMCKPASGSVHARSCVSLVASWVTRTVPGTKPAVTVALVAGRGRAGQRLDWHADDEVMR